MLGILAGKELAEDALIVVEATLDEDFSYVYDMGYEITKDKRYKTNKHIFLKKREK